MHSHTAFFLRTAKSTARTKECSTTVRISALMKALKHSSTMLTRHSIIWRDEPVVGRSEGVRPIWKSGWTLVLLYSLLSPRFFGFSQPTWRNAALESFPSPPPPCRSQLRSRIGPQFPHPPQLPQAIIVQPPCELLWIEPVQYGRSAGALLIGSCSSASVPQFEGSKWQRI